MPPFRVRSPFSPTGDQPQAIEAIAAALRSGARHTTLKGATGTGKTFTMACVIEQVQKPTLVLSHNKTLAAQLYEEFRDLLPDNSVNYFVSYYDYYQPEAYIPQRDIYIEKDASRNDDLDRLRLAATSALLSREDVIVVASVSCIYGLGSPEAYRDRLLALRRGEKIDRRRLLIALSDMQYARTDIHLERGRFRARGDVVEVWPAYEQFAVRIELFGDDVERIELIHPASGEVLAEETAYFVFPAVHYLMPEDRIADAVVRIREELDGQVAKFRAEGKLLEAQRLLARTKYDLEMIQEVGYCSGVENYSAPLEGRSPGTRPHAMLDYMRYVPGHDAEDWLVFIDESHVTIPQIRSMHTGDRARKSVLVDHGFRLPSAMDNRPLTFEEFEELVPRVVYVSATPGPLELERCEGVVIEQVIRPTGLLDPEVEIRPSRGQVPDMLEEARRRAEIGERVLVTVLTKRMAEDLTAYLDDRGLRVRFLHSEIDTLERLEILRELREGRFDVLVGVNLLREGLDLPEVSLVCIVDADKTGFLRSETSLIQTMGRAARHVNARVIMYADGVTPQMQAAIDETERRRVMQKAWNEANGVTATSVTKAIRRGIEQELSARRTVRAALGPRHEAESVDREELLAELQGEMLKAAERLDFETAARLRDRVREIERLPEDVAVTAASGTEERKRPGAARSKEGITRRKRKR